MSDNNKKEIEELTQHFQFLLSKISHEIRNPVTLIHNFLQMTESSHPEVESYEYWEDIRENMDYLILLLNDLSTYNNAFRLHREELDLTDFLHSVLSSLTPMLRYLNITLKSEISKELPGLSADKTKLRQAILNIARNACEAVEENGEIKISAFSSGNEVLISIADNGCGIKKEDMDSLFEPFVTHKKEGTGLGLPISRQIIQAHGGSISVDSVPGRGSCFTIRLPL